MNLFSRTWFDILFSPGLVKFKDECWNMVWFLPFFTRLERSDRGKLLQTRWNRAEFNTCIIIMSPFEEMGIYCFALVSRSVGR